MWLSMAEVVYVPTNEWVRVPAAGPLVAAKHVEYYYQTKRAASPIDEGMLLIAQALIFSRAAAVVGTLTSNYLLVVVELAELQRPPGAPPLEVIDLDGNAYFPCGCQDPFFPCRGAPSSTDCACGGELVPCTFSTEQ